MSRREAERLGGASERPRGGTVQWKNKRTGETMRVPRGIDPGWDYNPGLERQQRLMEGLGSKIGAVDEELGRAAVRTVVAAEIETQTRRRIEAGGPAPDSKVWAEWSKAYAARRRAGGGKLFLEGDLLGSLQSLSGADEAEVGTNLVYGAIHQFGGAEVGRPGLTARPYLGLSSDDEGDIEEIFADEIKRFFEDALRR